MNVMASLYHRSLKENLRRDETTDEFLAPLVDSKWENRQIDSLISPNIHTGINYIGNLHTIEDEDYTERLKGFATLIDRTLNPG